MAYNKSESLGRKQADSPQDTMPSSSNDNPDLSTVDKTWGLLSDGKTLTERFGQLARGIANHVNNTYAPKKTLAIPPAKMTEFYTTYRLDNEIFPLIEIFQMSYKQISWIYRFLRCEYHLVPDEDLKKAPTIPALTPSGFNRWMTLFVLAYPNDESKRLHKVVEAMPIDADGVMIEKKPERLPKQLSRHLLPPKKSRELRKLLLSALPSFEDVEDSKGHSANPRLERKPGVVRYSVALFKQLSYREKEFIKTKTAIENYATAIQNESQFREICQLALLDECRAAYLRLLRFLTSRPQPLSENQQFMRVKSSISLFGT